MKKLFSLSGLVFLLIAMFTGGCEKPLDEQLLGKWEVTFQKYEAFNVDVLVSEEIDTMEANEMVIEILSGGTGSTSNFGVPDSEFTWTLNGSMLTVTLTSGAKADNIMEFEASVKKDKLTLVSTVEAPAAKQTITKMVMTITAKRQ
jgi:hypothetical protein